MLKMLLLIWGRQFLEPPRAAEPLATPLTMLNADTSYNSVYEIIKLLSALYQSTTAELKNHPEVKFDIKLGVRQGGPESPLLFNLYLDYVLTVFLDTCTKNHIKFHSTPYRVVDTVLQEAINETKVIVVPL